ncbi:hypothetical protein GCM10009740_17240 [Terrabacter terrae]|uniref:Sensor domain-containing protein n=1 Tax=Terrabacter terrae TaxID=318434 RepID=A0ABN2U2W4_9MICO
MGNGVDSRPGRRPTSRLGRLLRARETGRRAATAAVARCAGLAAATAMLSACTAATPPGYVGIPPATSPAPALTTIDGMTAVPEAAECVNERLDARRSTLPGPQLFPGAFPGVVSVRLLSPGRDASDPTCRTTLRRRFSCREATTWAVPDPTEFLLTFGAAQVRIVEGASAAVTRSTGDGRGAGPPKRAFTYAEYTLATGDPAGAVTFERHAYATCDPATAGRMIDGVEVRTSTVGTDTGLVDVAFLAAGDRLAQVALSGSRWAPDERDHAWHVVAEHLQQER